MLYEVTLRYQYPAWNEAGINAITYTVQASSKSEANAWAKKLADRDGHLMSGKGRITFTAVEIKPES